MGALARQQRATASAVRDGDGTTQRLRRAGLAAAIAINLVLLLLLHRALAPAPAVAESALRFELTWISESVAPPPPPPPPLPVPPRHGTTPSRPAASSPRAPTASRPLQAVEIPATPALSPPPALVDEWGRPMLPTEVDPAIGAARRAPADARQIGRRRAVLPGRAEAIVDIGQLRERVTPQQVALGVAQFLLGAPSPDSCDKIEHRLLNETSDVVRDIDLAKWRRQCPGQ